MSPNNLPSQQSDQALQQQATNNRFGIAGKLAAKFQNNALTPLLAIVALLMGLFALLMVFASISMIRNKKPVVQAAGEVPIAPHDDANDQRRRL
jgi:hypothetical protein